MGVGEFFVAGIVLTLVFHEVVTLIGFYEPDVVVVEDFPRSAAGKTLKRVMREPYWAGRKTRI